MFRRGICASIRWYTTFQTSLLPSIDNSVGKCSPREGSQLSVWCASAVKNALVTGEYYDSVNSPGTRTELARDDTLAIGLWSWTQAVVTAIPFDENTIREPSMVL
jgi:hypothetical protein